MKTEREGGGEKESILPFTFCACEACRREGEESRRKKGKKEKREGRERHAARAVAAFFSLPNAFLHTLKRREKLGRGGEGKKGRNA